MRYYTVPRKKEELLISTMERWIRGLNTLVSNTQIKPEELSEATDVQLVEDGKVQCPRDGQAYYGITVGSRVNGLYPFYKSDGTRKLFRTSGQNLYYHTTTTATTITGKTYTDNLNTNGVMAYDRLYLCNGTDPLTYTDGDSITTFSAVADVGTASAVRTSGTTGSYIYQYKVTAVTAVGETYQATGASTDLSVDTLSTTAYVTVTWTASTSTDVLGYNIYGRNVGDNYRHMKYVSGSATTSYIDQGQDTPSELFTAPEANTTSGPIGKYVSLYKDSLFVLGDPDNPSRLYYSGGGDKIHDFSVANGGGFIDVAKNDGQKGTGLVVFKNSLIVFKEDSIYQFSFTSSGLPQIVQVNPAIGCIAPRSIVAVENDIFFASRRGIFTLGNEQGWAFDILRTNEISAKVRSVFQSIATGYLENIAGVYATKNNLNLVIFSYTPSGSTTNSKALVYDRERLGWLKWNNINANCFANFIDSTGTTHVLYGDDSSGYVKEILTGSDDFGSALIGTFKLRAESFGKGGLNRYKKLKLVDLVLREPTGSITLNIITDGVTTAKTVPITTTNPSVNWGHYVLTDFLLGESYGTGVSAQDENLLKTISGAELSDIQEARSFMLEFTNVSSASFTLLGAQLTAKPKSRKYRHAEDYVS
jgi:hypothetical protein